MTHDDIAKRIEKDLDAAVQKLKEDRELNEVLAELGRRNSDRWGPIMFPIPPLTEEMMERFRAERKRSFIGGFIFGLVIGITLCLCFL